MDRLLELLKRIMPEVDFESSSNLIDDGVLDSMDIVSIIQEIEEEYKIEIDPNEIDPDNFQSAVTMLKMIEKSSNS